MYYFAEVIKKKDRCELTKTNYSNISRDVALAVLSQGLAGNLPDAVVFREVKDNTICYRIEAPQSSWDEWT
jgi:hypothetical protein